MLVHRQTFQQPVTVAAVLPPPHGRLFLLTRLALSQHEHLAFPRQQLDPHVLAGLLPGQPRQRLLQLAQHRARRAHQVVRPGLTHLGQRRLARNAAIHHPCPARLAVAILDLPEEVPQRRVVDSVARQHLVGQRKAPRRDDQRDHHLPAIAPAVVPTYVGIAVAGLGVLPAQALEVRAGQVVE